MTVIFSNELQFSLLSDIGSVGLGLNNYELNIKRLQPTVRHGGYSVIVWGTIWNGGHLELVKCLG